MSDVYIRKLSVEDWQIYRSARLSSLKDSPDSFGSTFESEALLLESDWKSRLSPAPGTHLVLPVIAEAEGKAVALAFGVIWASDPKVTHIFQMWVSPEVRGRGIARAMLDRIISWAEINHCELVALSVTTSNNAAIGLYQASGFSLTGQVEPLKEGSSLEVQAMVRKMEVGTDGMTVGTRPCQ